ncbi:MAG: EMC3/TMCO1 family protein [Promethearchaeota archaeon]|jgi:hypothetical protein
MANGDIIIQIMLITIGMVALSEVLNKILGINMEAARELREKSKNLQERMQIAKLSRDPQEMIELQRESVELYKQLMKKQLLPSCVRCLIFWAIFAVIGIVYADYATGLLPFPIIGDGWFSVYFLFSITFSLIVYGFKRLYRKLTGKQVKRDRASRGMLGGLFPQTGEQEQYLQLTREIPQEPLQEEVFEDTPEEKGESSTSDSWKERLKK